MAAIASYDRPIATVNTQPLHRRTRDAHTWLLLSCAALLAMLQFATALAQPQLEGRFPPTPVIALVLLTLPALGVWRGRGRSGFWYALMSTVFVAHAFVVAAADSTQMYGYALLAASLVLFTEACAYARHRGLAAD